MVEKLIKRVDKFGKNLKGICSTAVFFSGSVNNWVKAAVFACIKMYFPRSRCFDDSSALL